MVLQLQALQQTVHRLEDLVGRNAAELAQLREQLAHNDDDQALVDGEQRRLEELALQLEEGLAGADQGGGSGVGDDQDDDQGGAPPSPATARPARPTRPAPAATDTARPALPHKPRIVPGQRGPNQR